MGPAISTLLLFALLGAVGYAGYRSAETSRVTNRWSWRRQSLQPELGWKLLTWTCPIVSGANSSISLVDRAIAATRRPSPTSREPRRSQCGAQPSHDLHESE